jgi:16S rRNA (guanine1207-N2)-methyltransferase
LIHTVLEGLDLRFDTEPGLFSPDRIDEGTKALLSCAPFVAGDKVLDLGCGYGAMGVVAARRVGAEAVFMVDVDPRAVACAARNIALNGVHGAHVLRSDGFRDLTEAGFTKIVCNPPYHTDFSVAKHFIEKGFNRLLLGGALWMVTKREDWYRNKLTAIFGGVRVRRCGDYVVFEAIRKSPRYANRP